MAKANTPHVVMGTETGKVCLYCKHCGEAFPVPTGSIDWFAGVTNTFAKVHANCKPNKPSAHRKCDLQDIDMEGLLK
jgi:hypothetical protein